MLYPTISLKVELSEHLKLWNYKYNKINEILLIIEIQY